MIRSQTTTQARFQAPDGFPGVLANATPFVPLQAVRLIYSTDFARQGSFLGVYAGGALVSFAARLASRIDASNFQRKIVSIALPVA
jgi:hypothetical protein